MQSFLLVGLGGAIGAVARHGAGLALGQVWRGSFPLATLVVNVGGSLAMGLLVGWLARSLPGWHDEVRLFVGVGLLGGFTTFSAFSLDVVALYERGEVLTAVLYAGGSVILAVAALAAGLILVRAVPA